MKKNRKGFTLIELLAVIVILGLLMAIAIPSVTRYITQSRRKTVVSSINSYVTSVLNQVNDGEYKFSDSTKIYAVPIECIPLEKGGTNPFGNWLQANEAYWAYVLVQYDNENYNYTYGFTFKDDAGYGMYPTSHANIDESGNQVKTGYDDLNKPETGLAIEFVTEDKWSGFEVASTTQLVVLEAESEGVPGNGETTCTLCQKGDNYDEVNAIVIKNVRIGIDSVYQNFQYEEGMTWGEWIESEYNTTNAVVRKDGSSYDGTIIDNDIGYLFYYDNDGEGCESFVDENDLINTNYIYSFDWGAECYF